MTLVTREIHHCDSESFNNSTAASGAETFDNVVSPPRSPRNFDSFDTINDDSPTITLSLTSSVTPARPHPHSKKVLQNLEPAWCSPVWISFLLQKDSKFAECNKCKDLVARGGDSTKSFNTTNLVQHLRSKHSEEYSKLVELKQKKEKERADKRKQKPQGKSISGLRQLTLQIKDDQSAWDINDFRACAIHKKLGEMIAIDVQPLYIVEDPGFTSFVKSLEPRYKILSRKYFTE